MAEPTTMVMMDVSPTEMAGNISRSGGAMELIISIVRGVASTTNDLSSTLRWCRLILDTVVEGILLLRPAHRSGKPRPIPRTGGFLSIPRPR